MELLIVIIYSLGLFYILIFSLGQLHLAIRYMRNKKHNRKDQLATKPVLNQEWPNVTIQLPVYNEYYVIEKLINAIASFDYPLHKFEIQVLDDSDDETAEIIDHAVNVHQKSGIDIKAVRRTGRKGYKAGALDYGIRFAKGDYIAIFDADFLPQPAFLKEVIPEFYKYENLGMVQTRWGHLNEDYSILTKMQAFGLNGHFSIEQSGRSVSGSFINFNGTAGVWSRKCINDAGGWSADTLSEDLDLSYRAQMKGWQFKYLENVETPGELPIVMPAIKSQQFRWNKGAAECARKHWQNVVRFRGAENKFSWLNKLHALFHLLNSSIFIATFIVALLSIPMLLLKANNTLVQHLFHLGSICIIGFLGIGYFYWQSVKASNEKVDIYNYLWQFPLFIAVTLGLSLHNAIAVIEGFLGFKSSFIRTPKFNLSVKNTDWKKNKYLQRKINPVTLIEGLLSIYFIGGILLGLYLQDYGLILFHFMLVIGFGLVSFYSVKQAVIK